MAIGRAQRAVSAEEPPVRGHELAGETEALLAVERVQAARARYQVERLASRPDLWVRDWCAHVRLVLSKYPWP